MGGSCCHKYGLCSGQGHLVHGEACRSDSRKKHRAGSCVENPSVHNELKVKSGEAELSLGGLSKNSTMNASVNGSKTPRVLNRGSARR